MPAPTGLFALGLTLRAEHSAERRLHVAHLAGRLGYASVWLPIDGTEALGVDDLVERARPARVGVVLPPGDTIALNELPPNVLIEMDPPTHRADAIAAVGGADGWRARVHVRGFDPDAAGSVVAADDRDGLVRALAAAAAARADAGRPDASLTAVLTVSIGRTAREARARALRDPALAGAIAGFSATERTGEPGLFGTLEQAQEQALALRRAGADAIRVIPADEWDVADVLAQLRAVVVSPVARALDSATTPGGDFR